MKSYRSPTGEIRSVADDAKEAIAALEAQGFVVWDAAAIKAKQEATEKQKAEDAKRLADAQKEMAERYPQPTPPVTTLPAKATPAEQEKPEPPAPAVPKAQPAEGPKKKS